MNLATQHAGNQQALKVIYSSLVLVCKVFYSLNFQDLPEFFEDKMDVWMSNFHTMLTVEVKCLETGVSVVYTYSLLLTTINACLNLPDIFSYVG